MAYLALTRRAVNDLENIERYSIDQWGERVANEYLTSIEEALQRLKKNPELARSRWSSSWRAEAPTCTIIELIHCRCIKGS